MKEEIWKDIYFEDKGKIYDYRGLYQVSNLGRVKRLETYVKDDNRNRYQKIKEHFLKNSFSKADGYFIVNLHKNGKLKRMKVHRLIAFAFIKNENNYPIINHIDGNKLNNNLENLEWCTYKHNTQEAIKNGLSKPPKTYFGVKSSHHTPIKQYDKDGNFIKKWDLVKEASESLNISRSSIWAVCNNKRKSAGGFKWRYINE